MGEEEKIVSLPMEKLRERCRQVSEMLMPAVDGSLEVAIWEDRQEERFFARFGFLVLSSAASARALRDVLKLHKWDPFRVQNATLDIRKRQKFPTGVTGHVLIELVGRKEPHLADRMKEFGHPDPYRREK